MKNMYVYILECSDNSLYVGVTNDVGRRFIEHSIGIHEDSFTFKRRPLKLVFCRHFKSPMDAINFEKQIKRWSRSKKEALIKSDFALLHHLAKCQNDSTYENYTRQE
jgi:putative endonuclease